jgi:hypothetical protein
MGGHVVRIAKKRIPYKILLEKREGKSSVEDLGLDARTVLRRNLKKWVLGSGLDSSGLEYGQVAGCWVDGSKPSGSIEGAKFLDYLKDKLLLKRDLAPWT